MKKSDTGYFFTTKYYGLMTSIQAVPSTSVGFLTWLKLVHSLLNCIYIMWCAVGEKKEIVQSEFSDVFTGYFYWLTWSTQEH